MVTIRGSLLTHSTVHAGRPHHSALPTLHPFEARLSSAPAVTSNLAVPVLFIAATIGTLGGSRARLRWPTSPPTT
ncbi:hypothetical protein GCM10010452_03460 [Crossiella cryophila]